MTQWTGSQSGPPVLFIGTVTTGSPGQPADADIRDINTLDLVIPQGPVGAPPALLIGNITTGPPNSQASATLRGGPLAYFLDLVLPQGPVGPQGDPVVTLAAMEAALANAPTAKPADGSGKIWNNGGVLCIA